MLKSIPKTNQNKAMWVKFVAQENNMSLRQTHYERPIMRDPL